MLTLYFTPGSSSLAAHIALHEVGAAFEPRPVSLARGQHQSPEFLALNPAGQVPLLLVDGRPLTEVLAILFYLARRFPAAGLLPDGGPRGGPRGDPRGDAEAESQALSWMSFVAAFLHPARTLPLERALRAWSVAEARLGDAEWTLGGRYSIADIHLFRLFWRFAGSRHPEPGCFPRLEAHAARVMARPAVRKTFEIEAEIGYHLPP